MGWGGWGRWGEWSGGEMGWGGLDELGWMAEDLLEAAMVSRMDKGFNSGGLCGGGADFGRDQRV